MEYPLWVGQFNAKEVAILVLILLLMEYPLWDFFDYLADANTVLILLLMEYPLWEIS